MLRRLFDSLTARPAPAAAAERPVFLVGHRTSLFATFAPQISHRLVGGVAGVISDAAVQSGLAVTMAGRQVPFVTLDALVARAAAGGVLVAHFFDDLDALWPLRWLAARPGVEVVDFLQVLHALDLPHTYASMRAEHRHATEAADALARARAHLTDARSRAVFDARAAALAALDRAPLMAARAGAEWEYFGRGNPEACLEIADDEVYVDVGAADGDTIDRFVAASGGRFAAIHAFEPTPGQFAALHRRAERDPRIHARQAAVGETAGRIALFDNPDNPYGSNALQDRPEHAIEVDCVRLDDVVPACTLLKMDVEGYECRVVRGAARLIARDRPNLAITCYHYPGDLEAILDGVLAIHAYRHVALRHYSAALYDTVLLFSDRQGFGP
ncbi:MAG: FkbM family methyltransferase [Burkholderiales bacterium]|nr:FkbM family methyltransferase [Burkholderiales bacterium]